MKSTSGELRVASNMVSGLLNGSVQALISRPPDSVTIEAKGFHPLFDLAERRLPAVNTCVVVQRGLPGYAPRPNAALHSVGQLSQNEPRIREIDLNKVIDNSLVKSARRAWTGR